MLWLPVATRMTSSGNTVMAKNEIWKTTNQEPNLASSNFHRGMVT